MSEHDPKDGEHIEDLAVPEVESEDVKGGLSLNFTKVEYKNASGLQRPDATNAAGPGGSPA